MSSFYCPLIFTSLVNLNFFFSTMRNPSEMMMLIMSLARSTASGLMRAKVPSKILSASSSRRSPFEVELIFWSESLQILFDFQINGHLAPKTNLLVIKHMSLKTIYTNFYDTSWSGANSMSAFSPTLTFAIIWGSGCGSVGRAVASDSRGLWFESSHRQKFMLNIYWKLYWKDESKEKRGANEKKTFCHYFGADKLERQISFVLSIPRLLK